MKIAYLADIESSENGIGYIQTGATNEEAIANLKEEWEAPGNENNWETLEQDGMHLHVQTFHDAHLNALLAWAAEAIEKPKNFTPSARKLLVNKLREMMK
jgi:hypothetical protein